jgi:hypothetical protein
MARFLCRPVLVGPIELGSKAVAVSNVSHYEKCGDRHVIAGDVSTIKITSYLKWHNVQMLPIFPAREAIGVFALGALLV